jgi:hypothetical protein
MCCKWRMLNYDFFCLHRTMETPKGMLNQCGLTYLLNHDPHNINPRMMHMFG